VNVGFFVHGLPRSQGSKRHLGGGRMIESSKYLKPWRNEVRMAAMLAMADKPPLEDGVQLRLHFFFERPKSHFGTGKNSERVKENAPRHHISYPDLDKLERAIFDALATVCFVNDSQVCHLNSLKSYTTVPGSRLIGAAAGVHITLEEA